MRLITRSEIVDPEHGIITRLNCTKDEMTLKKLEKRRSKILHEMHKRSLENMSSFLDEWVKDIE